MAPLSQPYQHVKVPGFGCTYPHDFAEQGSFAWFSLQRLLTHDRVALTTQAPTILFPIEAGRGLCEFAGEVQQLDFEYLQLLPRDCRVTISASTPTLKLGKIEFQEAAVQRAQQEFNLPRAELTAALAAARRIPRTTWLNEVCHRYCFERSIATAAESLASQFLENELIKEVFFKVHGSQQADHNLPYFVELPTALRRALEHIEKSLYSAIAVDDLCQAAAASKPTLTRLFRKHLSTSPMRYVWTRRLEEADRLLLNGRLNVSQVSDITGFADSSSFTEAYKKHFGRRPSDPR